MRALVVLVPVILIVFIGIAGATSLARARRVEKQVDRAEELIDTLRMDAAQHVALGDNFAQIVLDEIHTYDNARRKELR
jgi:hypothetical protein